MLEKIKKLPQSQLVRDLKDIRVLGFSVFGALVLLVSWSGVNVIEANYKLEQQMSKLLQQNAVLDLENSNQKLKNEYYKTDAYLELQARKQLGKAAPGETLLLVPKSVALANTKDLTQAAPTAAPEKPTPPKYQQNLEAWRDFLFKRALPPSDI